MWVHTLSLTADHMCELQDYYLQLKLQSQNIKLALVALIDLIFDTIFKQHGGKWCDHFYWFAQKVKRQIYMRWCLGRHGELFDVYLFVFAPPSQCIALLHFNCLFLIAALSLDIFYQFYVLYYTSQVCECFLIFVFLYCRCATSPQQWQPPSGRGSTVSYFAYLCVSCYDQMDLCVV